jgi:hypothetical protein
MSKGREDFLFNEEHLGGDSEDGYSQPQELSNEWQATLNKGVGQVWGHDEELLVLWENLN